MPRKTPTLPTVKHKPFHCRKCSFKTTGPAKMHVHYVAHPDHNPKAGMPSAQPDYPRTRPEGIAKRGVRFCPFCGHTLRGLL